MVRTLIETEDKKEPNRVEIACDGCGRVFESLHPEDAEDFDPEGFLKLGGLEYCTDCQKHHVPRFAATQETLEAKHLQLRETITDPDELEKALGDLERSRTTEQGVLASPDEERQDN